MSAALRETAHARRPAAYIDVEASLQQAAVAESARIEAEYRARLSRRNVAPAYIDLDPAMEEEEEEEVRAADETYEDQLIPGRDIIIDANGSVVQDTMVCRGRLFEGLEHRLHEALETLPLEQPEGIHSDRVVNQNSGQMCVICSNLMLEWSVGGMACGHGMCGYCFVGYVRGNPCAPLACPVCRDGRPKTNLSQFQKETSARLGSASVKVRCPNDECPETYTLETDQRGEAKHSRLCTFARKDCSECKQSVLLREYAHHKATLCERRTYTCTYCNESVYVVDKAKHETTNDEALKCRNLVHCPRLCCANDEPGVDPKRFKANREQIANYSEGEIVPASLLEKMAPRVFLWSELESHACPLVEIECGTCGETSMRRDEHQCRSKHIRRKEMQDLKSRLAVLEALASKSVLEAENARLGVPSGFVSIYKSVHSLTERDLDSRSLSIDFHSLPRNMEINLKVTNRNGRIVDGQRNGKLKMNLKRNGQGEGDVPDASQLWVRLSLLQCFVNGQDSPQDALRGFSTKKVAHMSMHHFTFTRAADSTSADVLPLDVFGEHNPQLHNAAGDYGLMLELFGNA